MNVYVCCVIGVGLRCYMCVCVVRKVRFHVCCTTKRINERVYWRKTREKVRESIGVKTKQKLYVRNLDFGFLPAAHSPPMISAYPVQRKNLR